MLTSFLVEVILLRRRHRTYEYEYNEPTPYHERIRRSLGSVLLDGLLFFLVIPVPLIGLILHLTKVAPFPALWLVAYTAVTQTMAGLLFLFLTARRVGGFGKVGFFFSRTHGKRWMTTKEARQNTYLFGFILLVIGVLMILWTMKLM